MQMHLTRTVRHGAVALGLAVVMGLGAGTASASTIRVSPTPPSGLPSATSPIVGTGSVIGTSGNGVKSATFTAPNVGSGPVTGSCTNGNVSGRISGANPAAVISHDQAALNINTCTDSGNPNVDLISIALATPTTFTTSNTPPPGVSPSNGRLEISNPTFTVRLRTVSGLFVNCTVGLFTAGTVIGNLVNNDAGHPTVTFTNIRVKSNTATSTCASNIGDGSSLAQSSTFTTKLGPLRLLSGTPSANVNNFIGMFP